jgi:HAD superfamily hydrolase (TIGR01509 family)
MDGLMVDSEPVYQAAWQQAAGELGYTIDDELYARFVGRPTQACEAILVEEYGASFPLEAFRARWPVLWQRQVERVGIKLKPGLAEMLDYLEAQRLPVAVATSSDADYADRTLRSAGLLHRLGVVVSGDQVSRGKPEPDIYFEAARRLAVRPSECVVLEDSDAGIRAAAHAGMIGILVPHWPASAEARRAAFRVVSTLHEGRVVLAALLRDGAKPNHEAHEIRLARPEDVGALPEIERIAALMFKSHPEGLGIPDEIYDQPNSVETFAAAQKAGHLWVAIAGSESRLVGFAFVREIDRYAHLDEIDVLPAYGRQGIGSSLLAAVCSWAETAGYSAVTLRTFRDVPWNAPFYQKRGFRVVESATLSERHVDLEKSERHRGLRTDNRVTMVYWTRGSGGTDTTVR